MEFGSCYLLDMPEVDGWRRSGLVARSAGLVLLLCLAVLRSPAADASQKIDLVALLPVADAARGLAVLDFDEPDVARYLTSGWSPVTAAEDGANVWTTGRSAVIDFALTETRDRTLAFDVAAVRAPDNLPGQTILVFWNGTQLRRMPVPVKGARFEARVPAKLQRIGPNRIEIRPAYWLDINNRTGGSVTRHGVRVSRLQLEAGSEPAAGGQPVASAEAGRLLQSAGSVVTYHLMLPPGARLRGTVRTEDGDWPSDAEVAVYALDADAQQKVLFSASAAQLSDGGEIDIDLGPDHRAVALTLAVGGSGGGRVAWQDLRIDSESRERPRASLDGLRGPYNVIFVLLDTLRADHTAPYGSSVETPVMQQLAQSGVVFDNAFSNSSFTRSSVASLFTSLYPNAHRTVTREDYLPEDLAGLPGLLQQAGFATMAIINNSHVGVKFGFGRGFDEVEEIYTGPTRKALRKAGGPRAKAEAVWSRLVQPFVERHPDQPFFLYLHEIDPHGPYQPLPPYDSMYDFGYAGRLSSHSQVLRAINSGDVPLDDIDLRYLLSQYDGEISFMDAYLGWILDHLSETGLAKNTLVVLLSDHGEEFMEHGHLTHMTTVYDEVLRVPLIFSLPGVLPQGRRVEATAELTDVAPTVLDLLEIDTPASFQGRSLLGVMADADAADSMRPAFAMVSVGPWRRESVRLGGYKLLREERVGSAQPPDHQLFDIRRDPGETIDLWAREPVVGGALAHLLRAHRAAAEAAPADSPSQIKLDELDPKIRENMRMLGYIE